MAKPVLWRYPPTRVTDLTPVDPDSATADEQSRLDSNRFKETGAVGAPPPSFSQLVPLAGPFGDKPDSTPTTSSPSSSPNRSTTASWPR